ncbi:N-acyl homoserine lactonase family protein [Ectothiorhodospiraceae bacterium WFHF3C12]|nr:N-acyl homoserine lactonase family protein [Ectothiorhodospiraceae bacterium WFHF3C12]
MEHRYGSSAPQLWWVLFSRRWVQVPINVFVIEHPQGLVLFDTGLDPAVFTDPRYVDSAIGRFFMRRLFRLEPASVDSLSSRLATLGFRAGDVQKAIISHLHFDHVGGIGDVPQADLLVSRTEWNQLDGLHPERDFIFREHIRRPGARWRIVDFQPTNDRLLAPFGGCHDVMGDGAMILLPTPGHTPGSLSMLVHVEGRAPLLLIGDLAYEARSLMTDQIPGTGDRDQLLESYARARGLKAGLPGLEILPAHDSRAKSVLSRSAEVELSARTWSPDP